MKFCGFYVFGECVSIVICANFYSFFTFLHLSLSFTLFLLSMSKIKKKTSEAYKTVHNRNIILIFWVGNRMKRRLTKEEKEKIFLNPFLYCVSSSDSISVLLFWCEFLVRIFHVIPVVRSLSICNNTNVSVVKLKF